MKNIKNLGIKTLEGFEVGNLQRFPSMEWGDEGGLQADVYYKGIKILQVFQEGNGGCAITYTNANYDANQAEIDLQCLRFLQRVDEDYGPNSRYGDLFKNKKIVVEKGKEVAKGLDVLITRIYEDAVLGNLSQERYQKMSQSYEEEQERLKLKIEVTEEWVDQQMELEDNLNAFLALTEKYVDVQELTPTIVNEFIKKILVYAPDKSSGKRKQRVRIFFNFLDEVEIPAVFEPIIYERPTKNRKTA